MPNENSLSLLGPKYPYLAKNLQRFRTEAKLTIRGAAKLSQQWKNSPQRGHLTSITPQYIQQLEQGISQNPSLPILYTLAEIYKVPVTSFLEKPSGED